MSLAQIHASTLHIISLPLTGGSTKTYPSRQNRQNAVSADGATIAVFRVHKGARVVIHYAAPQSLAKMTDLRPAKNL
jgi:hypothetical protein